MPPVLIALLLAGASEPAPTLKDYASAQGLAQVADDRYRGALQEMLASPNPYARHEALRRLDALPSLANPAILDAVMARIDDDVPLYPPDCIGADERYRRSMAQGEIYMAARCMHDAQHRNSELTRRILARAVPDPGLTARLLRLALATRDPRVLRDPDPVTEVLRAAPSVPPEPFLDLLATPLDPVQRGFVLEYALLIRAFGLRSLEVTPIPSLLGDADLRTRCRAAMLVLLLANLDSPLRPKAVAVLKAGLKVSAKDGVDLAEAVAADLSRVGPVATPVVDDLVRRAGGSGYRGWTFEALAAIGPPAAAALPAATARLACAERGCVESQVLRFIASLGDRGQPATAALVAAAVRDPSSLEAITAALDAVLAQPSKAQWRGLVAAYGRECEHAGDIAFFSLSRDDRCASAASHLEAVGRRAGFKVPVGGD